MLVKTIVKATRPSFLVLSPVCVLLGLSTSLFVGSSVNWLDFALVLIGAIAAHISVNTLNEYYDFTSGLDLITNKTAFSGGSGALPENPSVAAIVLTVGVVTLVVAATIGIYFMVTVTEQILPLGIIGLILVVSYTVWLNRIPLLCLIAPGLGFGPLMVVGTHIVLTGEHNLLPWLVSLVPFLLTNNLLLLSQYPDINADAKIGRRTFPIVFGIGKSNFIYGLFALAAYLLILLFIAYNVLPPVSLIAIVPVMASLCAFIGARKHGAAIGDYPQYLAANVAAAIVTPLLLSIAIAIGL
jgi:1,4-dihydroxy-2-naphthoate octaprenyltransferase